jgi:signal peptidase
MTSLTWRLVKPSFAVVLGLIVVMPAIFAVYFGIQLHTVTSGSMRPAIEPGDVLITHINNMETLEKGDVVLLFDNKTQNVNSHRIVDISVADDLVTLTTKGDSNPLPDPAIQNPTQMPIQKVTAVVPKIGFLLAVTHSQYGIYLGGALFLISLYTLFIPRTKNYKQKSQVI